ncbi:MAG: hypothetical protein LQ340_005596 [Diploschistes diacapsis]|nr:MAG: hypothetical protein LQ340_005596 [Diploschistes diacapsis]
MRIKNRWLRDLASIVFTVYYLFAAEQADEKVRKVRGALTVDHLRVSWNKTTTPYLSLVGRLTRPKFTRYAPKKVRIPRPPRSAYKEPVTGWLYYDGPFSTIDRHDKIVLDLPGGGFVAMGPRNNDDKLFAWSGKTGLPVLSLDYEKAPENPYPYALNECYDVYHTLVATRGRCIGLSGDRQPQIVITGDSAGGNLATGLVLMVIQNAKLANQRRSDEEFLPVPHALVLIYPSLDMNINSWMTDEQMSLIQDQRTKAGNRSILRKKSQDYYRLDPSTPAPSDDEEEAHLPPPGLKPSTSSVIIASDDDEDAEIPDTPYPPMLERSAKPSISISENQSSVAFSKPRILKTRLAMSSMISYFNDRVITPEMMRAMVILYVGPHMRPDFTTDYLLSPLLAPEMLLAEFPKTYFMTGERDPLVDDTVIFAGRLRQAKYNVYSQRKELGLLRPREHFNEREHVEVMLIPGISHGFFQFVGAFPEGWKYILRCAKWIEEVFALDQPLPMPGTGGGVTATTRDEGVALSGKGSPEARNRHHKRTPTDSSVEDERPLEMTPMNNSSHGSGGGNARGSRGGGGGGSGRSVQEDAGITTRAARAKTEADRATRARQKNVSKMTSPKSEDDLLKRRMKGFTEGLMRTGEE